MRSSLESPCNVLYLCINLSSFSFTVSQKASMVPSGSLTTSHLLCNYKAVVNRRVCDLVIPGPVSKSKLMPCVLRSLDTHTSTVFKMKRVFSLSNKSTKTRTYNPPLIAINDFCPIFHVSPRRKIYIAASSQKWCAFIRSVRWIPKL